MAILLVNGCFDIFHEGHKAFLEAASKLGIANILLACVNTDEYARELKPHRGPKYPIDNLETRMENLHNYTKHVFSFSSEQILRDIIIFNMPCILVKGPDYKDKKITGADIAPVLILDTPEPESVKQMKLSVYNESNPSR